MITNYDENQNDENQNDENQNDENQNDENVGLCFELHDISPEKIRDNLLKRTAVEFNGNVITNPPASLLKTKNLFIQYFDPSMGKTYVSVPGDESKISKQTLRLDAVLSPNNLDTKEFLNYTFGTLFAAMLLGNGLKIFKYTLSMELSSKESRLTIYTYLNKSDIKGETKSNLEKLLKVIAINVKKDFHAEVLPLSSSEKIDYRASREGLPKFGRHDDALSELLIKAIAYLFNLE